MERNQNFDERQMMLRSKAWMHTAIFLLLLLLANALINDFGYVWADNFSQFLLIAIAGIVLCSVELIWRGVYFHNARLRVLIIVVFAGLTAVGLVIKIIQRIGGAYFVTDGMLSENGRTTVMVAMFFVIGISALIKTVQERRADRNAEQ
jgi:hypothetical protein